jgi:hypothetical protein
MAGINNQQLHHRAVGNCSFDLPQSVLPTSSVESSANSNRKQRKQRTVLGRMSGVMSKQSLLILLCGTMLGYVVVPVVLTQTSSISNAVSIQLKPVASSPVSSPSRQLGIDDIMIRLMEDKKLLSKQSLPTDRSPHIMETATLSDHRRKKILVTGGAGFVGSHLVDKLMMEGHEVTVVDNFFTGQKKNVAHWMHHPNFKYVERLFL